MLRQGEAPAAGSKARLNLAAIGLLAAIVFTVVLWLLMSWR